MKTIALVFAAAVLAGCAKGTDGAATSQASPATSPETTTGASVSSTAPSFTATGPSTFGVIETTRAPLGSDAQTCPSPPRPPGTQQVSFVQGSRPGTPIIEMVMPEDWTSAVSQSDPTLTLTGPDGLSGTLTVGPTELAPAEAFGSYADDAMASAPISSQSVLPAELCGYSGQQIIGTSSGSGGEPVQYADRIAHVWTNAASYLVAIHLQGPQDSGGFQAAEDLMLADFGIRLP